MELQQQAPGAVVLGSLPATKVGNGEPRMHWIPDTIDALTGFYHEAGIGAVAFLGILGLLLSPGPVLDRAVLPRRVGLFSFFGTVLTLR
jgi:hypothetical protein